MFIEEKQYLHPEWHEKILSEMERMPSVLLCRKVPFYDNYESKGAPYRSMNAEILRETLDRRLRGLFVEIVCSVSEILEKDAIDLLERILPNPKGESSVAAPWGAAGTKEQGNVFYIVQINRDIENNSLPFYLFVMKLREVVSKSGQLVVFLYLT